MVLNRYRHDTSTRDFLYAIASDCGRSGESVESLVRELIDKRRDTVFELHEISSREWTEIYRVPKSLVLVIRKYLNEIIKREPISQMRVEGSLARNEEKSFAHQLKAGVYLLQASNENTFFLPGQYFSIVIRCSKVEISTTTISATAEHPLSSTSSGASSSYPQNATPVEMNGSANSNSTALAIPVDSTTNASESAKLRVYFFQDSSDFVRVSETYKSIFSISNEQAPSKVECVITSHVKFGLPKIRYVIELKRIGNIEDDDYFDQQVQPQRSQSLADIYHPPDLPNMLAVRSEQPIEFASPLTEENLMLFNMTHRRPKHKHKPPHIRSQSQEMKYAPREEEPGKTDGTTTTTMEVGASDSGDNIYSEQGNTEQDEVVEEWNPNDVMSFYLASSSEPVADTDVHPVLDSADDSDHRANEDPEEPNHRHNHHCQSKQEGAGATAAGTASGHRPRRCHNRSHMFVPTMVSDELRSTVSFDSDISLVSSISAFSTELRFDDEG